MDGSMPRELSHDGLPTPAKVKALLEDYLAGRAKRDDLALMVVRLSDSVTWTAPEHVERPTIGDIES